LITAAGCSGGLHSDALPVQVYVLRVNVPHAEDSARPAVNASLRVGRPLAGPGLDSPNIVLVQSDRRMSYYTASSWPASLPEVVESLALQTLRTSGSWGTVQGSASPFPADYLLEIAIRRFEADYTGGQAAPVVHVVLDCTIGRRSGRDVIASFVAEGSAAATTNKLSAVVGAFEAAANTAFATVSAHASEAIQRGGR
jgi:cholesterol transport system auxiliary component